MKPLSFSSALVLCVATVAAGLFIYSTLAPGGSGAGRKGGAERTHGDPQGAQESTVDERVRRLDTRIQALADEIEVLRQRGVQGSGSEAGDPLDPSRLARLRRQIDEIEREREAERQLRMARLRVAQSGVSLDAAVAEAVAVRLARYESEIADLWVRAREGLVQAGDAVRGEHVLMRRRAERDLRALLPSSVGADALPVLLPPVPER